MRCDCCNRIVEIYGKNKDPFEEERFGLLQKILKLKEEIKRLRKDNYDYWTDADWELHDNDFQGAFKSLEKEINKK